MAFPGLNDSCDPGCSLAPYNQNTEDTYVFLPGTPQISDGRRTTMLRTFGWCKGQRLQCSHSEARSQPRKQNRSRGLNLERWTAVCPVIREEHKVLGQVQLLVLKEKSGAKAGEGLLGGC